jgi:hypothetical protein
MAGGFTELPAGHIFCFSDIYGRHRVANPAEIPNRKEKSTHTNTPSIPQGKGMFHNMGILFLFLVWIYLSHEPPTFYFVTINKEKLRTCNETGINLPKTAKLNN